MEEDNAGDLIAIGLGCGAGSGRGAMDTRRSSGTAFAGDCGDLRRNEPGCGGTAGRYGPADAARLGAPVQCRGAFGTDRPQGTWGRVAADRGAGGRACEPP